MREILLKSSFQLRQKKKVKFSDKWEHVRIPNSIDKINGSMAKIPESEILIAGKYPVYTQDIQNTSTGFQITLIL